jgi:hypothetical protein
MKKKKNALEEPAAHLMGTLKSRIDAKTRELASVQAELTAMTTAYTGLSGLVRNAPNGIFAVPDSDPAPQVAPAQVRLAPPHDRVTSKGHLKGHGDLIAGALKGRAMTAVDLSRKLHDPALGVAFDKFVNRTAQQLYYLQTKKRVSPVSGSRPTLWILKKPAAK